MGKRLFREALLAGTAEVYFHLSGNFIIQSEPAYCGLGSLAMTLNALAVDPGKPWKGPWRWYADDMLECAQVEEIKRAGLTFRQFATLARCNGLHVQAKRADQVSEHTFIRDVDSVCRGQDTHMVISFSRAALGQTGEGHFSPISAYHAVERQVLVMDTARFKYPSYFVDVHQLFRSMQCLDPTTQLPRGYFLLSKASGAQGLGAGLVRLLALEGVTWQDMNDLLCSHVPSRCRETLSRMGMVEPAAECQVVCVELLRTLFASGTAFRVPITLERAGIDLAANPQQQEEVTLQHDASLQQLVEEVKCTPLYAQLAHAASLPELSDIAPLLATEQALVLATLFLYITPIDMHASLPQSVQSLFTLPSSSFPLLAEEVGRLHHQFDCLLSATSCCQSPTTSCHTRGQYFPNAS
jgi:hypothetical protein